MMSQINHVIIDGVAFSMLILLLAMLALQIKFKSLLWVNSFFVLILFFFMHRRFLIVVTA
jgi:hypothetical protein